MMMTMMMQITRKMIMMMMMMMMMMIRMLMMLMLMLIITIIASKGAVRDRYQPHNPPILRYSFVVSPAPCESPLILVDGAGIGVKRTRWMRT